MFQKKLNRYAYLPWSSFHTPANKAGFIKGEAIRYARLCSEELDYRKIINLFIIRLQKRGYPLEFIQRALSKVDYKKRLEYLAPKTRKREIPTIFKVEYNPIFRKRELRTVLDNFTKDLLFRAKLNPQLLFEMPPRLCDRITLCFKLPKKLHKRVLKARKLKGF